MGPRRFKLPPSLLKLLEKEKPTLSPVTALEKTPILDPAAATKAETEAQLTDFLSKFALAEEKALKKEAKLAPALEKLNKTKDIRELSGFERWAEGEETSQSLRDRLRREFELGKTEGAKDIDLSKLKTAAGIGVAAVGAGLLGSEKEAEAGVYPRMSRKFIEERLKKANTFDDFLRSLKAESGNWHPNSPTSQELSQDILNHLILDRTGLPEGKELDAIRRVYPETKNIPIEPDLMDIAEKYKNHPDPKIRKGYKEIKESFGLYHADPLNIKKQNPLKSKISYDPEKFKGGGLASLLGHESQHLRDDIVFPNNKYFPYFNKESDRYNNLFSFVNKEKLDQIKKLSDLFKIKKEGVPLKAIDVQELWNTPYGKEKLSNILSPDELMGMATYKHHVAYPKNYELQKAKELVEQGIIPVNEVDQLKKMKQLNEEYEKAANASYLGKAAGIAAATGIGASALDSSSAQASEGPNISRSDPEFVSDVVQPESKDPLSHFEQKYGTYDIPGGVEKLLETVDKYTGRPVRAAALSALKGESPVTGAIESVSKNQDVEGRQVARQFLQNLEDKGFKTRAPVDSKLEQLRQLGVEIEGKKPEEYLPSNEFPAEGPLGFAADMTLDPTNLAGMGLGTKVGKGFSKVRGLMK